MLATLSDLCENRRVSAPSIRARVRAEMIDEIKSVARRHLATDGANLSLRAVARDMGMVSSALYRYFPSRDELLTALIVDAYEALGDAAEASDAAIPRTDVRGRWMALCHAVRTWALANPAEYALIYGSPVPGYAAPPDTVAPASRVVLTIVGILRDAAASGHLATPTGRPLPEAVRADMKQLIIERPGPEPLSETQLALGFAGWSQLFGLISFEVFSRFEQVIEAREAYFDYQMEVAADLAGLP
jgi:AcrR family transcriptional regulator